MKAFAGDGEVRSMLTLLLEKCYRICSTDDGTTENKMAFLPSFISSLASILKQTQSVSDCLTAPQCFLFTFTNIIYMSYVYN